MMMSRCIPGVVQQPTVKEAKEWWNNKSVAEKHKIVIDTNNIYGTRYTIYSLTDSEIIQLCNSNRLY